MAKKKKAEEHENLERWLVSYADFMTLLFATFVVLYALAQSNVVEFMNIADGLKQAFEKTDGRLSVLAGGESVLDGQNAATSPLMIEYMSAKYEQTSYEEIKDSVNKMNEDGVSAVIDERGLVIKFDEDAILFARGTAEIDPKSYTIIDKVAQLIKEKFAIHFIEIDGHTDSDSVSNKKYPSNWELSSARASSIVRYLIAKHKFNPRIFTAVGYADTAPVLPNANAENKAKNRRVEIVVLKNKHKGLVKKDMEQLLKEAKIMQKLYKGKPSKSTSDAIQELVGNDKQLLENVIDMSSEYEKETKRLNDLNKDNFVIDGIKPDFME